MCRPEIDAELMQGYEPNELMQRRIKELLAQGVKGARELHKRLNESRQAVDMYLVLR